MDGEREAQSQVDFHNQQLPGRGAGVPPGTRGANGQWTPMDRHGPGGGGEWNTPRSGSMYFPDSEDDECSSEEHFAYAAEASACGTDESDDCGSASIHRERGQGGELGLVGSGNTTFGRRRICVPNLPPDDLAAEIDFGRIDFESGIGSDSSEYEISFAGHTDGYDEEIDPEMAEFEANRDVRGSWDREDTESDGDDW